VTDRYAVIGNPIAHSKSPEIHVAFARATGEDLEYTRILAPLDGFAAAVAAFRAAGGRGLNVTLPFKGEAPARDGVSIAPMPRAVNTLRFRHAHPRRHDGSASSGRRHQWRRSRTVCSSGAGASQSVIPPCSMPVRRHWSSSTARPSARPARAPSAGRCRPRVRRAAATAFDVVNALRGSRRLHRCRGPARSGAQIRHDLGKGAAAFLAHAREAGAARVADGLGMLVEQAAESFFIWRGVRPETAPVLAMLRAQA
jgi:shikimate dehydrogenase